VSRATNSTNCCEKRLLRRALWLAPTAPALQMVKDMLDESSFDASPGHVIPDVVGKVGKQLADKLAHGSRRNPER
jgi:hypothetical protein